MNRTHTVQILITLYGMRTHRVIYEIFLSNREKYQSRMSPSSHCEEIYDSDQFAQDTHESSDFHS